MSKLRLVFADTETTGLADSVEEAIACDRQVIEYAFAVWEEGQILDRYEWKVMPTGDALKDAEECAVKGWNHFKVNDWLVPTRPSKSGTAVDREYGPAKPWSLDDCANVERFLRGEMLAGSNPRFDLNMFKAEFRRLDCLDMFPKLATHRMMNTGDLAWLLWSCRLVEKTGLETLAKFFNVEHKAHTAMGDVLACIGVFEAMCDHCVGGPRRLKEIAEAIVECMPSAQDRADARAELAKVRVL